MQSAVSKGLLVGFSNLCVVAVLIAVGEGGYRHAFEIMIFLLIAGCGPAIGVGAITGWVGSILPVARKTAMTSIALVSVFSLGAATEPEWIVYALVPTVASSLWLERWTRDNLATRTPAKLVPQTIGMILGAVNVIAISILVGIYVYYVEPEVIGGSVRAADSFQFGAIVLCLGMVPGIVLGAVSGMVGQWLRDRSQLVRYAGIATVALGGVFFLGAVGNSATLVMPALMPTLILVGVLERLSRNVETFPSARAVRG